MGWSFEPNPQPCSAAGWALALLRSAPKVLDKEP